MKLPAQPLPAERPGETYAQWAARTITQLGSLTVRDLQLLYSELYGAPTSASDRMVLTRAITHQINERGRNA